MDSMESTGEAVALYEDLSELWRRAGMHVRKWLSNSPEVLAAIPEEDRAIHLSLTASGTPSVKMLGVLWSATNDMFEFQFVPPTDDIPQTKRSVLRKVASIFDPLGFISPYTVQAKIILQDILADGLDWDEPLSDSLC